MPAKAKRKAESVNSPKPSKKARVDSSEEVESASLTPKRSARTKVVAKTEGPDEYSTIEEEVTEDKIITPKKSAALVKKSTKVKKTSDPEEEVAVVEEITKAKSPKKSPKKKATKKSVPKEESEDSEGANNIAIDQKKPAKQKRKTKEEKEAEMAPLAPRTQGLKMFVGAHVSAAGGVHNSIANCLRIGGNAWALFLKNQKQWKNPPLDDAHKTLFHAGCKEHSFASDRHVLPHGSYLVNLAQKEKDKATQAFGSFIDDLKKCEALGIKLYNFHPGNTGPNPRPEAISRIAQAINKAHKETETVIPVLETMAGGGNIVGSTFEDLRDAIAEVEDKSRVGVCIDTCHVFAAGYDIRTPEAFRKTLDEFDKIVGMKYLKALHLNDSKAPLNSHRDLHQNIGLGFLGLQTFHNVMNELRFEDLPMVLETPEGNYAQEIKLLESLIGMDASSEKFKTLETTLAAKGAEERKKIQAQVDKKAEKDVKKATGKGKGRKKKALKSDEDEDGNSG